VEAMLRLIMRRGPTPGAIYELNTEEITVGRGSKNDIVIRDNDVGREHCRLVRLMDDYEVQDLNSETGTFVNGQRVINTWLMQPGTILELGDMVTLEYQRVAETETKPRVSTSELPPPPPNGKPGYEEFHASFIMTEGINGGQTFVLRDLIITLGRDLSNDIVIQDPEISRHHARLRRWKNGYSIEDTGSTNGTFVNGHRLKEPRVLEADDVVRLGTRVQLQYVQRTQRLGTGLLNSARLAQVENVVAKDETIDLGSWYNRDHQVRMSRLGTGLLRGGLTDHIFVAYAREEWEKYVAPLTISMQDAGLRVWVDQYLVQGSDDWRVAIEQALQECWLMVLVSSPRSLESNYVKLQYRHFLKRSKPLLLLNLETVSPMPSDLSRLRSIQYDNENARKSFHKLVFEIMQTRHQA
jgi:pSer/pThr/pTyr-binding forkhead associated (FHA) protein